MTLLNSRIPDIIITASDLLKTNPVDNKNYLRKNNEWIEAPEGTKVSTATETTLGIVMPDGVTTGVDAEGKLNANKAVDTSKTYTDTKTSALQTQLDSINSQTDVVDTVNTYVDLEAYDTTKLKNKNVISVLNDESHDHAHSYYRWNATAFEYIGSTSATYTKAESDTLLLTKVDKVEGKQLSTNDFTDVDKASLVETVSRKKSAYKVVYSSNLTGKITPDEDSLIEATLSTTGGIIPNPFGNDSPVICTLDGGNLTDDVITWTTNFIGGVSFLPGEGLQVVDLTPETNINVVRIHAFTTDLK